MRSRSTELHVVLGATGAIGSVVVRELLRRGHHVRAVHTNAGRVPRETEQMRADLFDPEDARLACEHATVVYHCAQPRNAMAWPRQYPVMTRRILEATTAAEAKLVVPDRLDVYGKVHGPITEDTPPNPAGRIGRLREALTEMLLSAHRLGRTRVVIGRSSDYYGPRGVASVAGASLFEPALKGDAARWIGALDQPHSLHYLDDIAKALVTLGEHDEADGAVWHLPAADPLTGREFLQMVYAQVGHTPQISLVSRNAVRLRRLALQGASELREALCRFEVPFVVHAGAYEQAFGPIATTPHERAVAETLTWFRMRAAK